MNTRDMILIVGVGSAHGDDQAGWLVADELARRLPDGSFISVRKASVPLDFLDWLENIKVLHLIDAIQESGCGNDVRRLQWNSGAMLPCERSSDECRPDRAERAPASSRDDKFPELAGARSGLRETMAGGPPGRSSHGFSVPDVLRLAEQTGMLPEMTMVWAIPGSNFQPGARMSEQCQNNICKTATQIMEELSVAYA
jgi:Ni,Fe-hydrogenase maturation factor